MTASVARRNGAQAPSEMLSFRMPDGVEIAARVIAPPAAPVATALVLHGNGMHGGYYVPFARLLSTHGLRLVLMDQRGHGQSGGERGHIERPMQYADDVSCVVEALATQFPEQLFVLGHSAGAAILLKASSSIPWQKLAGIALLTPTFASDASMVRRSSGNPMRGAGMRYMLRTRPSRIVRNTGDDNRMEFFTAAFLLSSWFGIGKRRAALTYIPSLAGEAPYTYSCAGLAGTMVGRPEPRLARVAAPVFLATGDNDIYVDDAAVQSIVPWGLRPEVPLTSVNCLGGDHFTTLMYAIRPLSGWISHCVGRSSQ